MINSKYGYGPHVNALREEKHGIYLFEVRGRTARKPAPKVLIETKEEKVFPELFIIIHVELICI